MTSCVRVLSVQTVDSSPSLLLVAPNGSKTLVNCGEGCQRVFLEFGQKVSSVTRVCLTHLAHDSIGGLPGMILTTADVVKLATQGSGSGKNGGRAAAAAGTPAAAVAADPNGSQTKDGTRTPNVGNKAQTQKSEEGDPSPGLDMVGPVGTQQFIRSLRHFMRRESFQLNIKEGAYHQTRDGDSPPTNQNFKKRRRQDKGSNEDGGKDHFTVQSIVCTTSLSENDVVGEQDASYSSSSSPPKKRPLAISTNHRPRQILSFLFTTPIVQGRFLADKAKALGIPKGPLYGQLKSGKSVTFVNPATGEQVVVESSEVVEPSSPGVVVAVLCYPNEDVLRQLIHAPELGRFQSDHSTQSSTYHEEASVLEIVVHMAPRDVYNSEVCTAWRTSLGTNASHLFVTCEACVCLDRTSTAAEGTRTSRTANLSPFHAASVGARLRSQVAPGIYVNPIEDTTIHSDARNGDSAILPSGNEDVDTHDSSEAVPMLEFVLLPRSKRGFRNQFLFVNHWNDLEANAQTLFQSTGCTEVARRQLEAARDATPDRAPITGSTMYPGEILFTGTGSAIPCKHRNVSGIYLGMKNGNSMLLDVGEGTVGQLLRAKHNETRASVLQHIKAVWISHPHADHHLGLLRLLADRKKTADGGGDPLIIMAPPTLLCFLEEYELVVPDVAGSYSFLDCRDLTARRTPSQAGRALLKRLQAMLGVTSCAAVPVAHCADSFAVVFHGTSFGSVAYSGDCRPSTAFAETARNADVLIHEATFADGLEADAVLKKHCTVGEALRVGREMKAKTILLTHFSQRYPKIPPLPAPDEGPNGEFSGMTAIPVFDFMRITPFNIASAAMMTPALQLLYPESPSENEPSQVETVLAIPGLFARSELL